jgi:hypothetical protein
MKLTVRPKTLAVILFVIAASLGAVGIVLHLMVLSYEPSKLLKHLDRLFNLDGEANIPTVFSAGMLFVSAALLWLIAFAKKQDRYFLHWLGLALILFFVALDESVQLHESIINAMRELFGASGYFYFAWVIPYGIIAFFVALAYLRFVLDLPRRIGRLFIVAAFCYVGSALGLEMVHANYRSHPERSPVVETMLIGTEEFFEMSGIIILIYALLCYAGAEVSKLEIKLSEETEKA